MAELVRDIMDPRPVSVHSDTPVEEVIELLRTHELPGVPVTDANGLCVGIVTERDLVIADEEGDLHLPHYVSVFGGLVFLESLKGFEKRLRKAFAATAADMMTPKPKTIGPTGTVAQAGQLIASSGHNRLPVTDDSGHLVGVVTRVDVLEAMAHEG